MKLRFPGNMLRDRCLAAVTVTAVIVACAAIVFVGPKWQSDSSSYFLAWERISAGIPDHYRLPLYPAITGLCSALFSDKTSAAIAIITLQYAVGVAAVIYLFKTLSAMGCGRRWALAASMVYIFYPGWFTANSIILTEPLSMSLVIFMVYALQRLLSEGFSAANILQVSALLVLMIALRPSFLYMLGVVAVAAVMMWRSRCKAVVTAGALAAICLCLAGYCALMKQSYGVFQLTGISTFNRIAILWDNGTRGGLLPEAASDPELRAELTQMRNDGFDPTYTFSHPEGARIIHLVDTYGLPALEDVAAKSLAAHPEEYLACALIRWQTALPSSAIYADGPAPDSMIVNKIQPPQWLIMAIVVIYIVFIGLQWKRRGKFPQVDCLIMLIAGGQLFVNYIAGYNGWGRLSMPILPIILIMLTQMLATLFTGPLKR